MVKGEGLLGALNLFQPTIKMVDGKLGSRIRDLYQTINIEGGICAKLISGKQIIYREETCNESVMVQGTSASFCERSPVTCCLMADRMLI